MRWLAAGVAVAIGLGAVGVARLSAAPNTSPASLTPITPCRLTDTRPAPFQRGPRSTPLAAAETYVLTAWGANGDCTIPASATALSMNVTVVNGTANSFLTVFPADVAKPEASSSNWTAGQAATPNAVTSPLSADGKLAIYNLAGTVDVVIDVVGYYQPLPPAPTTVAPTTTLPAYRFEAAFNVNASANAYFALDQSNQVGLSQTTANLVAGWLAPRNCTITGSVVVVGGVQSVTTPNTGFTLAFSRFNTAGTFEANGAAVPYRTATVSGTRNPLGSLNVGAGDVIVLSQLTNGGITLVPNTRGYLTAECA
jgi:hypothetical protein